MNPNDAERFDGMLRETAIGPACPCLPCRVDALVELAIRPGNVSQETRDKPRQAIRDLIHRETRDG